MKVPSHLYGLCYARLRRGRASLAWVVGGGREAATHAPATLASPEPLAHHAVVENLPDHVKPSSQTMQIRSGNVVIECITGNIAAQHDIEAVVNAANAELRTGGGVAGALHVAAGPGLEEECRPLAPIRPGEAVITGAHRLPNRHVIHCLGPIYGIDEPEDALLAQCYENALRLAEEREIESLAFPALSTGAFGYPLAEAAGIAFSTILSLTRSLKSVRLIRFVLFDDHALGVHEDVLRRLSDVPGTS